MSFQVFFQISYDTFEAFLNNLFADLEDYICEIRDKESRNFTQ